MQTLVGYSDFVNAIVFSPDGKFSASVSDDIAVRLWDSSTDAALQILEEHLGSVNAVAFSGSVSSYATIRLWDTSKNTGLQTREGYSGWVTAIIFSPDGKLLASSSNNRMARLWASSTEATL